LLELPLGRTVRYIFFAGQVRGISPHTKIENERIDMRIERVDSKTLVMNRLPDGSRVFADAGNETVFALNATAGAAWDACSSATTLSGVAKEMRRSFDPHVSEELAQEAIQQLQEKNLVTMSGSSPAFNRRRMIASLGAVALPLVVSLTLSEQRANTVLARSVKPCATAKCGLQ